ncbi:MAG: hypothetical protein ABMB14_32795 [Myxococcota bacterium]
MNRAGIVVWVASAAGCAGIRPIQQVTTIHEVEQQAAVSPPSPPLGATGPLDRGMASVVGGASFAAVQGPVAPSTGQQVAPLLGIGRLAGAVSQRVEFVASGAGGPATGSLPGQAADDPDGLRGFVGWADTGMRVWAARGSNVQWGFSFDLGAEASVLRVTDRWVTETRVRGEGTSTTDTVTVSPDVTRVHPDLKLGTVVRVPVPQLPAHAVLGLQLETWPVYWSSASSTESCVRFTFGDDRCRDAGGVPNASSRLAGVFTPTLGASVVTGDVVVHVLGYANLGGDVGERVPGGVVALVELPFGGAPAALADAD